jgi:hypothetical protein
MDSPLISALKTSPGLGESLKRWKLELLVLMKERSASQELHLEAGKKVDWDEKADIRESKNTWKKNTLLWDWEKIILKFYRPFY